MAARFGNIGKLPSGRYRARYYLDGALVSAKTPDGRPLTFQTKTDAGGWLAQKQAEVTAKAHRPAAVVVAEARAAEARAVLFGPFAEADIAARTLEPRALEEYGNLLRRLIMPTFAAVPLVDVTPPMVREWHRTVMGDRTGKTSGATTRARAYGLLKSIMNTALADELIPANPCNVRGAASVKAVHKPVPVTGAQLRIMVGPVMPEQWRAMFLMMAWCGLRIGEVIPLRRCDITEDGTEVFITRGAVRLRGQGIVVRGPKTEAGRRAVAIPAPVAAVLVDHLARLVAPHSEALLFPSATGNILPSVTTAKYFKRARIAAGRPDLTIHDFRHTGATWAAQAGATTKELMQRIGHTTPAAAMRYQHASRTGDQRIADRLAEMMADA